MPSKFKTIDPDKFAAIGMDALKEGLWQDFLNFLVERQRIWHRKEVEKLPPPWTEDPILQKAKIINVYRELDRNTRYEIEHIRDAGKGYECLQIEHMIVFRHTNSPKLFESLISKRWALADWKEEYARLHAAGHGVSRAMLFNTPRSMPYWEWVFWFYEHVHSNATDISVRVMNSNTGKELFNAFDDLPNIGEFFAYEMYTSSTYYDWCPFTEDDFLIVGPGAVPGMELILGLPFGTLYQREAVWLVKHFAPLVKHALKDRDDFIWIPKEFQPKNPEDHKFTQRTLEHCLCEFRKYITIKRGLVGIRRKYTPTVVT
jgi:hypothetical protein